MALSPLRDRLTVRLFRLMGALAACVPLPLGYWLAGTVGELYFWLNSGHSRHAVANMAVVLAQHPRARAVRRPARRSFRHYGMYMLDFFRLPSLSAQALEHGIESEGWEHIDAALARGRGIIIVALHFGSWERAAPSFGQRGYRAHILVDTFRPPALNELIQRTRAAHGHTIVAVEGGAALRRIYAALRRNEIVVLLVDRPQRERGTPVTFFGRRTWLPSGPAMLVQRTGAALLHVYVLRRPGARSLRLVIEPPIEAPLTDKRDLDEQTIMQAIVDRMQRLVQRHPEQWYMFRPMWPDEVQGNGTDQQPEQRSVKVVGDMAG